MFREEIAKDICEELKESSGVDIHSETILGVNDTYRISMIYGPGKYNGMNEIAPLDSYIKAIASGKNHDNLDALLKYIVLSFETLIKAGKKVEKKEILSSIYAEVVDPKLNERFLENFYHINNLFCNDLDMIFKVKKVAYTGIDFYLTRDFMDEIGLSPAEVAKAARKNTFGQKVELCPLSDEVPEDKRDKNAEALMGEKDVWYFMSYGDNGGASCIIEEREAFKKMSDYFDDDLIIIPASRKEILLVRAFGKSLFGLTRPEMFKIALKGINQSAVKLEDQLSYDLFMYDRIEKEIKRLPD